MPPAQGSCDSSGHDLTAERRGPPISRLVNSTHKISDYLPGQSSSTLADAFFYTLDRVDNENN